MAAVESRSRLLMLGGGLLAFSLFLTAYSASHPWLARLGVHAVGEVLRPLQFVVSGAVETAVESWERYVWLIDAEERNTQLGERLEALEAENSRLLEWESEILRLRKLLNVVEDKGLQGIAADVIGYDPSNWVRAITIDRGSLHGISPGLAVIEGDAVVGQIIATSPHTSRVLLLTDHASAIDGLIQTSRGRGVLHGIGREFCELRYVMREDEVQVGDRVVTSGMDKIFPKGVTLGVVASVEKSPQGMFHRLRVSPAADLKRLETVLVVTSQELVEDVPIAPTEAAVVR